MSKADKELRQQNGEKLQKKAQAEELVKKAMANYATKYSPDFPINPAFANYIKSMSFESLFDLSEFENMSSEGEAKIQEAKKAEENGELKASQLTRIMLQEEKSILAKMKAILHDLEDMEKNEGVQAIHNEIKVGDALRSLMGDFLFLAKLDSEVAYSFDGTNFLYGQDQRARLNADIAEAFYDDPVISLAVQAGLLMPRKDEEGTFWITGRGPKEGVRYTLKDALYTWEDLIERSLDPALSGKTIPSVTWLTNHLFNSKTRRHYTQTGISMATQGVVEKRKSPNNSR